MNNYLIAIIKVLKSEGGHANDPDDGGGETYRGIARKFWPQWAGWKIIDAAKMLSNFPKCLSANTELQNLVIDFYKVNFCDKIGGDSIGNINILNMLVDTAVLEGITSAIKRAQKIVNLDQTGYVTNELLIKLNSMA